MAEWKLVCSVLYCIMQYMRQAINFKQIFIFTFINSEVRRMSSKIGVLVANENVLSKFKWFDCRVVFISLNISKCSFTDILKIIKMTMNYFHFKYAARNNDHKHVLFHLDVEKPILFSRIKCFFVYLFVCFLDNIIPISMKGFWI